MKRHSVLAILLLIGPYTFAGHGLMNSFAGIEWLPPPGLSPSSPFYWLDGWRERFQLWRAQSPAERITRCERYAREKLAEIEAMIRARDAAAIAAVTRYQTFLDCARAALNTLDAATRSKLALGFATDLLEHQYIVTTDYLDLPRDSRRVALAAVDIAAVHFAQLRAQLPRRLQDSLFFMEEEVRWSRDQAHGADAQGL